MSCFPLLRAMPARKRLYGKQPPLPTKRLRCKTLLSLASDGVRDMKGNNTCQMILVKHLLNDIPSRLQGLLRTKGCSTNEHRQSLLTSRSATASQAISIRREVQSVIRPPWVVFSLLDGRCCIQHVQTPNCGQNLTWAGCLLICPLPPQSMLAPRTIVGVASQTTHHKLNQH